MIHETALTLSCTRYGMVENTDDFVRLRFGFDRAEGWAGGLDVEIAGEQAGEDWEADCKLTRVDVQTLHAYLTFLLNVTE